MNHLMQYTYSVFILYLYLKKKKYLHAITAVTLSLTS